ncbi:hypothetical protein [Streptomyces sp. NPDC007991]|uniref:hypothetical protein n=1 Tax=Streptomyces sp. NPDC007991 TaxID=3364803 RepID=UPI0036E68F48
MHEIGHWLNLRHIWGDDDEGCSGSDFVADDAAMFMFTKGQAARMDAALEHARMTLTRQAVTV